ncbi:MAG TPA: trypsin-like peptidase domain-containing protein [Ornithinimicrobium sp.]|uniref:trypsin-like peptidase domain-containing protein n=1 Tax=Ornithinimicrobium sp. TaxID=1977084 RepID=UPI002B4A81E2|nr:trypsin-like peptidase domain-containing protein [Ornithinimicrobium sp.]HKJ12317.1 trypsin-like peptidase domain-containing protein [Ornithinimicrobium sp.]
MENEDLTAEEEAVPAGFEEVALAREAAEERLLGTDNVVGVGLGYKISNGVQSDTKSVMVLVSEKLPSHMLTSSSSVPKTVSKMPTDVLDVGHPFAGGHTTVDGVDAQTLAKRVRPVRPGYSVGHFKITAGTIGAGCYDLSPVPGKPPRYYILSNNHVLANSNQANIGDPIYQPGPIDGGGRSDAIGRLSRFVPIKFDGSCNTVDAAVAEVPFDNLDRDIYWTGYPASAVKSAKVGQLLKKTGRTTHFTTGRVTAINATVNVNYGGGNVAKFCNQIVTTDMSAGGDSGSLVLDTDNNPVGLLFAGSSTATILNPIALVQLALKVRVWP